MRPEVIKTRLDANRLIVYNSECMGMTRIRPESSKYECKQVRTILKIMQKTNVDEDTNVAVGVPAFATVAA